MSHFHSRQIRLLIREASSEEIRSNNVLIQIRLHSADGDFVNFVDYVNFPHLNLFTIQHDASLASLMI